MGDKKIRIVQLHDGKWVAGATEWLAVFASGYREAGREEAMRNALIHGLRGPIVTAPTPWEASAAVYEALGEDAAVEWETLPWTTLRIAHGITSGVCELLGAGRDAKREIAKAKWEAAGRFWLCWRCREPAPLNAEEAGWRYGSDPIPGEPGWDGWLCPPCRSDMPGAPRCEPKRDGGKRKRKRSRR